MYVDNNDNRVDEVYISVKRIYQACTTSEMKHMINNTEHDSV